MVIQSPAQTNYDRKMQNYLPCEFNHQLVFLSTFSLIQPETAITHPSYLHEQNCHILLSQKFAIECCDSTAVTFVVTFRRHERLSGPELVIWLLPQHLLQIIVPDSPSLPPTVNQ